MIFLYFSPLTRSFFLYSQFIFDGSKQRANRQKEDEIAYREKYP